MSDKIAIRSDGITITQLDVPRKDVAEFLRELEDAEAEPTLIHAIEIGVFCLEHARMSRDTEFVRRQVDSLLSRVEIAVEKIPTETKKALLQQIGTENGQILAPIKEMIDSASKLTSEKVKEVRTLLTQEIDPEKETTTLGKALRTLRNLLDPKRTDSVQCAVEDSLASITAKDGVLATTVKQVVETAVEPLVDELDKLAMEVRGNEAAAEAIQQTTLKGAPYEEEVAEVLRVWAQAIGAEVDHIGVDNQPGDVLITVRGDGIIAAPMSIIVESRDRDSRAMGRRAISAEMSTRLGERKADAGVYVSRTQSGLSTREIGEWAEGLCDKGPWVACTNAHLVTAVRFLLVQRRLTALRASAPEIDFAGIEQQVTAIRTSLGRIRTIKTKVTELNLCSSAIDEQVNQLRDEVKEALFSIEDVLRAGDRKGPVSVQTPLTATTAIAN